MSLLKSNTRKRIGIFGGTFDPINQGHLRSIDLLMEQLEVQRVHWVLSARPPHKDQVSASIEHRFSMLEYALSDKPAYVADDTEITRAEKSYTIETIEVFEARYPNADFLVIIGADSLLSLSSWHRYSELIDKVNWVVMQRPGYSLEISDDLERRFVDTPEQFNASKGGALWLFKQSNFDVSSTQLRAELANSASDNRPLVKQFLASDVINYIHAHHLYKIAPMKPEQIKQKVVQAVEDMKAQDVRIIDVKDVSNFTDFMIVVSGTSDTHVKAIAREASDSLRTQGVIPLNEDGADVGEWVLVDFGDVVLHVMRPEVREYYDLEKLWDEDVRKMVEEHREGNND